MRTYSITIDETQFEAEPKAFFLAFKGVKSIEPQTISEAIEYDPRTYDKHEGFQEIDVHLPGLPLSPAYVDWYNTICDAETDDNKDISFEMLKIRMEERAK